mgnify:CR=1 FL=1
MILLDSLYRILPEAQEPITQPEEGTAVYDVLLDGEHGIYAAHFPGSPITPGVCLVQMAVELLSCHLNKSLALKSMVNTKFLKPVSPMDGFPLTFEFKYENKEGDYCANCSIAAGKDVCARMKLICRQS